MYEGFVCFVLFFKKGLIECTSSRMSPNIHYELWVIVCQGRFNHCNEWPSPVWVLMVGKAMRVQNTGWGFRFECISQNHVLETQSLMQECWEAEPQGMTQVHCPAMPSTPWWCSKKPFTTQLLYLRPLGLQNCEPINIYKLPVCVIL